MILGLLLSIAAPACPPDLLSRAPQPAVRRGHELRLRDRIELIEERLASGRYDVILFGDSITQQWPQATLDRAFPGKRVLNAGVSGDGAAALLFRLDERETLVPLDGDRVPVGIAGWRRQSPGTVVLMIGTNDLPRMAPCDVAAGILAAADRLRAVYPRARVLVLPVLPRGERQDGYADEIAQVNATVRARVAARGAPYRFLDVAEALRCRGGAPCDVSRPPNHVHLTPRGYERLRGALTAGGRR